MFYKVLSALIIPKEAFVVLSYKDSRFNSIGYNQKNNDHILREF